MSDIFSIRKFVKMEIMIDLLDFLHNKSFEILNKIVRLNVLKIVAVDCLWEAATNSVMLKDLRFLADTTLQPEKSSSTNKD